MLMFKTFCQQSRRNRMKFILATTGRDIENKLNEIGKQNLLSLMSLKEFHYINQKLLHSDSIVTNQFIIDLNTMPRQQINTIKALINYSGVKRDKHKVCDQLICMGPIQFSLLDPTKTNLWIRKLDHLKEGIEQPNHHSFFHSSETNVSSHVKHPNQSTKPMNKIPNAQKKVTQTRSILPKPVTIASIRNPALAPRTTNQLTLPSINSWYGDLNCSPESGPPEPHPIKRKQRGKRQFSQIKSESTPSNSTLGQGKEKRPRCNQL